MKVYKNEVLVKEIAKDLPILIFFHMNGCGHCDDFKPVWKEIAAEMKSDDGILLADMELSEMKKLPKNLQNVFGFPSIQIIKNNKKIAEFSDFMRTKENVIKFAKKYSSKKEKLEGGAKKKLKPISKPKPKTKPKTKAKK